MTSAPRDFASCIPMGDILEARRRPLHEIDARVIGIVRAFCRQNGRAPSLN